MVDSQLTNVLNELITIFINAGKSLNYPEPHSLCLRSGDINQTHLVGMCREWKES
jgi:hypothetical protein